MKLNLKHHPNRFLLETLNSQELVKYFTKLDELCERWNPLENQFKLSDYTNKNGTLENIGPSGLIKKMKTKKYKVFNSSKNKAVILDKDFAGLYLFSKDNLPFYCGISRNVIKRILNHQKGLNRSMATLAHRMSKEQCSDTTSDKYKLAFDCERKKILDCDISLIKFYKQQDKKAHALDKTKHHKEEIMLYLFEVFVSVKYNTAHNTFRTH